MGLLIKVLLGLALVYAAGVAALWYFQRSFVFPGAARQTAAAIAGVAAEEPSRYGLPGFTRATIETSDGERLNAWWKPPDPGRSAIVFLHGNGGDIAGRAGRARILTAAGDGLLLVSWRGYPGSTGSPSEPGLLRDGEAAVAFVRSEAPGAPVVLYGESLGSGVAVRLAAQPGIAAVILDAPYAAIVDIAARLFWYVPVRLLLSDSFRSIDHVGAIKAPLLVLHGEADRTVPFGEGQRLFAAAPEPKRLVRIPAGPHMNNLEDARGQAAVRSLFDAVAAGRAAQFSKGDQAGSEP